MNLSDGQLEWIVQEVLRRLTAMSGNLPAPERSELVVEQKLITTHTLANRLDGVTLVRIPCRSVITPAAKDLLRDRGVELTSAT